MSASYVQVYVSEKRRARILSCGSSLSFGFSPLSLSFCLFLSLLSSTSLSIIYYDPFYVLSLPSLSPLSSPLLSLQAQYVFIHDSLSELVVCGETDVAAGNIRIRMMQLQKPVPGGLIGFQKQFEVSSE